MCVLSDRSIRQRMSYDPHIPCATGYWLLPSQSRWVEQYHDCTDTRPCVYCGQRSTVDRPMRTSPLYLGISPFAEATKIPGAVSFGLTSYGYDFRLGTNFIFDPGTAHERKETLDSICLPAHSMVLGESLEHFQIPEDIVADVMGKSTLARRGIDLNTTPLEPGWRGIITIEITNVSNHPVLLRAGEGIGQVRFNKGDVPCDVPYNRKPGASYQDQSGVTKSKV